MLVSESSRDFDTLKRARLSSVSGFILVFTSMLKFFSSSL